MVLFTKQIVYFFFRFPRRKKSFLVGINSGSNKKSGQIQKSICSTYTNPVINVPGENWKHECSLKIRNIESPGAGSSETRRLRGFPPRRRKGLSYFIVEAQAGGFLNLLEISARRSYLSCFVGNLSLTFLFYLISH